MLPIIEIPNENYREEKQRQRGNNTQKASSPLSPPVYYVLHGGGMIYEDRGKLVLLFDDFEMAVNSSAIIGSRDRFFRDKGGYLKSEPFSDKYNLSLAYSGITQEQINSIRKHGGLISLSLIQREGINDKFSLYFYFISDTFTDTNE